MATKNELSITLNDLAAGNTAISPPIEKLHLLPHVSERRVAPFTAEDAERLAGVPHIESITRLSLVHRGAELDTPVTVTADAWPILAEKLPHLSGLNLNGASLSADSARALASSALAERLSELDLCFVQFEPGAADALLNAAESHPKAFAKLKAVSLRQLPFSASQAERFTHILARSAATMENFELTPDPTSRGTTDTVIGTMLAEGHAWPKLDTLRLGEVSTFAPATQLFKAGAQLPAIAALSLAAPAETPQKSYAAIMTNASLGTLRELRISVPGGDEDDGPNPNDSVVAAARMAKTQGKLPSLERVNGMGATRIGPTRPPGPPSRGGPPGPPRPSRPIQDED